MIVSIENPRPQIVLEVSVEEFLVFEIMRFQSLAGHGRLRTDIDESFATLRELLRFRGAKLDKFRSLATSGLGNTTNPENVLSAARTVGFLP